MVNTPTAAFFDWMASKNEGASYSKNTARAYTFSINLFLGYLAEIGLESPFEANEAVIRAFAKKVLAESSKSTKTNRMAAISLFYRWAQFEGLFDENPVKDFLDRQKGLRRAREPRMISIPVLSDDEVDTLIETVEGRDRKGSRRDLALIGLILDTGLRVSEVLSLTLRQGVDLISEKPVYVVGKGNRERRVASLGHFSRYVRDYIEDRHGGGDPGAAPLFYGRNLKEAPSQPGVYRMISRALARSGVTDKPQRGPHLLRHTAASRMLRCGWSLAQIRDALGHDSILTTERYLHTV